MKKRTLLPVLGIILLAHAPSTAHGQQLTAGDSIRVKPTRSIEPERKWAVQQPRPQWTEATVVRLTADTLWYESSGNVSPISMDDAAIQRPTARNHRWAGAAMGGVTLGVVSGLITHKQYEPRSNSCSGFSIGLGCGYHPNPLSRGQETALGVAGGALVGGFFGWVLGRKLERWETVELDQVMIGDGNLAVSLSIRR